MSVPTQAVGEKNYSENLRLIRLAQGEDSDASEKATEELLRLNAGLVRSMALRFRDRGVDMEDLLQIGTVGMLKAVRSFDEHDRRYRPFHGRCRWRVIP